ncbi:MAG: hypothetical protein BWY89_00770 [Bacteroidetes bacterium ADurb.BinA012]|nr:MAG: hypothetical protein BWY89_00770 [Bacteroidetes bacterium ADurb.BinA012]
MGFSVNPLSVLPVFAFLGYLPDVYFGIEVCGEGFAMIAGVAVNYIEVVYLAEVMFRGMCCKDTGDTRVKAAAKYRRDAGFAEALMICPLP